MTSKRWHEGSRLDRFCSNATSHEESILLEDSKYFEANPFEKQKDHQFTTWLNWQSPILAPLMTNV